MPARIPRPDDVRCQGIYGEKYKKDPSKIGQQCEVMLDAGKEFCAAHGIPEHRRCHGKGRPHYAMKGQSLCGIHGGKTPRNLAAAARRQTEERAQKLVTTYGLKIETTAVEALLQEVQWTAGHVMWLRERVQEIEADADVANGENPLIWGKTKRKTGGEDWGETHEAVPSIWLRLYQQERTHLVKVCSEAIRAGIEERRVRLAESQGEMVAQAIRSILDDLHLTPAQQALIAEVVPRHLRALAS
jgi:hypothetical protein